MGTTTHVLHNARATNNCPECYGNDGLEFTFSQKMVESVFMKKPDPKVTELLYCHTCNNQIYPVSWTDDIERVYKYNKKIAEEKRLPLKLKPLLYGFILLDAIIVGGLIYYFVLR